MNEELKTRVWLARTPDECDAVIVSFVDGDDISGIYFYEPGADPVELDSVGMNGVASEFEHATVTVGQRVDSEGVRLSYGPANHHWKEVDYPGDVMITMADSDARVDAAVVAHDTLVDNHEQLTEQAHRLFEAVQRQHDEARGHSGHPGSFTWCQHAVCSAARDVVL